MYVILTISIILYLVVMFLLGILVFDYTKTKDFFMGLFWPICIWFPY